MKRAIGTSSAIMFITAIIGATVKDVSLSNTVNNDGESLRALDAIMGSLWLLPGAFVGGWCGAKLTSVLPVKFIRSIFALLVTAASIKMLSSSINSFF